MAFAASGSIGPANFAKMLRKEVNFKGRSGQPGDPESSAKQAQEEERIGALYRAQFTR